MESTHNVIIVGIPDSGKTNYLIRLWLALRQNNCLIQGDGDPDDIEYLEAGATHQLGGKYAPHTSHDVSSHNSIPVKSSDNSVRGILKVPDYSGEVWEQIYRSREWPNEWDSLISANTAFLIFVRADSDNIVPLLDWISHEREFGDDSQHLLQERKNVTPTEVLITEWLQFFRRVYTDLVGGKQRLKIGIIVSAWDAVPEDQKILGPDSYIETNYPMLEQFMEANFERYEFKTFGVSITDGDLNKAKHRNEYFEKNPKDMGSVVSHEGNKIVVGKDLTFPIFWGMGVV